MKTALLIIALSYSSTLCASPKINVSFDYYKIYPSEISALASELNLMSLSESDGKRYRAHTAWDLQLDFQWNQQNNRCSIDSIDTTVNITYTMPALYTQEVDRALKAEFNHYYQALMRHEKGHETRAVQAAKELGLMLKSLPAMSSCTQLNKRAHEKSQLIITKYKQLHTQYDEQTQHGRTQGASMI